MRLNYLAYYMQFDGYGRFNSRLVQALIRAGIDVKTLTQEHLYMPRWMQERDGLSWDDLTLTSLPPYLVKPLPGRQWLLTMIEGSVAPHEWVEKINASGVQRVLVPCEHNRMVYQAGGVLAPIDVLPGGTDPAEFPLLTRPRPERPYTFLTLGDRWLRKGWLDVYKAFYIAFSGKTTGRKDVRLVIKSRSKNMHSMMKVMEMASGADERIIFDYSDAEDMYEVFAQADCVALPSRSEGWGMPHREAACMGLPVITQEYAGLDDGNTYRWSLTVPGTLQPIPLEQKMSLGEWQVADVQALAKLMSALVNYPKEFAGSAKLAAQWIRENQTWEHSARRFMELLHGEEDNPSRLQVACTTLRNAY